MNNAKLPKKIVKLIFISLFVSLLLSIYITYKYDKFESDNVVHSMVKGDAHPIWKRAAKLKKDLLKPTKIYVAEILKLNDKGLINGCANITGGGLVDNLKRVIPNNLNIEIDLHKIVTPEIFKWIKKNNVSDKEMLKTFNCGVGFCIIINPKNLTKVKKFFTKEYKPYVIGAVTKGLNKIKLHGNINWE